ncbi:type II toxin-antitoxin system VapC family toxin [Rhodoferax antarcticus]|uniref:type II toxin-antitoxin system VapC family toxin n=1 Tax=Rhodoferax antarcticus TaxID=81479 RepID=UPI002224C14F|nr:type II toxin-antitoxin system VapC family toxin [Rhodoferax antarcticus]MCW2312988.1 tRNA(fMet)-specific endonuclease VapC [Rhodoferax antarcticus]
MTHPTPLWLLDTNIISSVIKRPHDPLSQRLRNLFDQQPGALATSVIVECELMFGARRVSSPDLNHKIDQILRFIPVHALTQTAVTHYANIRSQLEKSSTPIGFNDTLIAAHALALGATLVSGDAEFSRVPGLKVENWLLVE